jgi:hypothetical protein|tara:strand:+ start:2301 stop:2570 length:270 start_codon:yes stop_codon:yes gene_type:complete
MKLSNIFEDYNLVDSSAYKSLSPKLKTAVNEFYKMLDNRHDNGSYQDDNFCENIEDCVKTIVSSHDITKEQLLDYIELEVREQLKQTEV